MVVATGIFALAVVSVLGVLAATSKSIVENKESDDASRLLTRIQAGLQEEYKHSNYSTFVSFINSPSSLIYANRSGEKIGSGTAKISKKDGSGTEDMWPSGKNGEKFFEIKLLKNDNLDPDPNSGFIAFNVKISWPAYMPTADGDGSPVEESQRNALIVPSAIVR